MANLSTLYHKDYSGGQNDSGSDREIERNEGSSVINWDIDSPGKLTKPTGLTQVGGDLSANATGFHAYLRSTGAKDLLVKDAGVLKYLNSTTWTSLDTGFTAAAVTWMETCPLNDKVYISNETDVQHSWDRAAVTENSCLTELAATIPHGNVLKWWKNHMFTTNNVNVNGTKYPTRFYWSAMGDPGTYDTTNDYIIVPGGGNVVTFGELGDSLVIFCERSVKFLSGWGDTDWQITATASSTTNLDETVGTLSPRGGCKVGNEWWFIDDEGMIRRLYQTDFDAYRHDIISTKILTTLGRVNKAQLSKAVMYVHNDIVYVAVPIDSSTTNNLVLRFHIIASKRNQGSEAWTVRTGTGWTPTVMISYPTSASPDLYFVNTAKQVVKLYGTSDLGVAIASTYESKNDDMDKPEIWKRFAFGYISGESSSNAEVEIYSAVDYGGYVNLGSLDIAATGSKLGPTGTDTLGPTGVFKLGGKTSSEYRYWYSNNGGEVLGKRLKTKLYHATKDIYPEVNGYTSHFKQKNLR